MASALVGVVASGCNPAEQRGPVPGRALEATVERVVDGDTISVLLDGGSVSVRYIGVDTPEPGWPEPEPECFSEEATDLNRELVEGRRVRLVVGEEPFDPYDRLLAYVYAGSRMVNAELIRAGAAETLTIPPNDRFADRFAQLEGQARAGGRGIWGSCR